MIQLIRTLPKWPSIKTEYKGQTNKGTDKSNTGVKCENKTQQNLVLNQSRDLKPTTIISGSKMSKPK